LSLQVNRADCVAARRQRGTAAAVTAPSSIGLSAPRHHRRTGVVQSLKPWCASAAEAEVSSDEKASPLGRPRSDNCDAEAAAAAAAAAAKSARKQRRQHRRRRRDDAVPMQAVGHMPITHDSDRDSVSSLPSTLAAYIREELELWRDA
jgi:hypothetical protein